MAHARSSDSTAIGLLLDQEKAYDRVHPEYLQRVLQHFGFPPVLVQCIANLFFGSSLHININGHLSQPVPQLRGLRQGDPLSPVLFNLAFEPLLRRIIHDQAFQGFSFPRSLAAPAHLDHNIKLLAYADDIACFLQSPTDLRILNNHLATYSAASNARINFHKTEAFALSGKHSIFHSTWRTPLTQSNIHAWHDCNAPEPIVYLGYPIFHNSRQRNVFQDRLLKKIENACNIHNHRSLSFRGRVTIANCLVLSKLWYVLRVFSVTKQFLSSVVSIVAKFITARCFPKISFSTMTVPRKFGGLGLLNPFIQQSALQLRWLIPLLRHSHLSPEFWCSEELTSSIVLPLLADYLIHLVEISMRLPEPVALGSDFRLPFLFPSLRPLRSKDREHPLYLLYQAIDALPKDFSTVVINPETAMHIPLGSIINPIRNFPLRPSILKLPASSAYIIDSEFNFTRPRSNLEIVQSPRLVKMFLKAIRDGHLQLAPFFLRTCIAQSLAHLASPAYIPVLHHNIDVSRFIKACTLAPSGKDISSKEFRKLCRPPTPESPPSLSSTKWLSFWRFPIHLQARTVWYRVLHGKLATRSTLFKLLPELVDSPQCAVCNLSAIEDTDHFLYDCPPKMLVWKELWPILFSSQFSASLLKKALFKLEFPDSSLETEIPSAVGIASILLSIWRAHFNLVFNLQPFIPSTVVSLACSVLLTYSREHLLQSGGSPFPLPHFCL
ncbi:hypothetical protein G6F16_012252 [Rhizopus arrhizus]|nr:hypothetical protein G6F16_012252 [Rhizopus arrhizus]